MCCRSAMGENMAKSIYVRLACVSAAALLSGLGTVEQANAGGFSVREQSTYFEGMGFAGSAAGGDISSMYWNSAATATLPGFNVETSGTIAFGSADMTATGGALLASPVFQNCERRDGRVHSRHVRNLPGFRQALRRSRDQFPVWIRNQARPKLGLDRTSRLHRRFIR